MRKHLLTEAVDTAPAELTIIAQGARFEGAAINVSGDLRVDGEVQVEDLVVGQRLIVGPTGQVEAGRTRAADAVVAGSLQGRMEAESTLVLKDTGRISGVIVASRLIVEEGGICDGTFSIGTGARDAGRAKEYSLPDQIRSGPSTRE